MKKASINYYGPEPVIPTEETSALRMCDCCGKSGDELEPLDKESDPTLREFDGDAYLFFVAKYSVLPCKDAFNILKSFFNHCITLNDFRKAQERFKEIHDGKFHVIMDLLVNPTIETYELCKDCIVLDEDEFYAMRDKGPMPKRPEIPKQIL
jgi:hypothetical protein